MNKSEDTVYQLLTRFDNGKDFRFFEIKENNITKAQTKRYSDLDDPVAYPDFERYIENELVLLIEVKGYDGFFDQRENTVAMLERHFNNYLEVQKHEALEIQVVFVIWSLTQYNVCCYFWESLNNLRNTVLYKEKYEIQYKKGNKGKEQCLFWNTDNLRTDIWEIGQIPGYDY